MRAILQCPKAETAKSGDALDGGHVRVQETLRKSAVVVWLASTVPKPRHYGVQAASGRAVVLRRPCTQPRRNHAPLPVSRGLDAAQFHRIGGASAHIRTCASLFS
jgi:hypothetical protein